MKRGSFFVLLFVQVKQVYFLFQMENFDSSFNELKSHLAETNEGLEELNNTLIRKVKT